MPALTSSGCARLPQLLRHRVVEPHVVVRAVARHVPDDARRTSPARSGRCGPATPCPRRGPARSGRATAGCACRAGSSRRRCASPVREPAPSSAPDRGWPRCPARTRRSLAGLVVEPEVHVPAALVGLMPLEPAAVGIADVADRDGQRCRGTVRRPCRPRSGWPRASRTSPTCRRWARPSSAGSPASATPLNSVERLGVPIDSDPSEPGSASIRASSSSSLQLEQRRRAFGGSAGGRLRVGRRRHGDRRRAHGRPHQQPHADDPHEGYSHLARRSTFHLDRVPKSSRKIGCPGRVQPVPPPGGSAGGSGHGVTSAAGRSTINRPFSETAP